MYTANTKEEAYDYYEGSDYSVLISDPTEEVWFRFRPLTYGTSHYRVYTSGMISAQCEITDQYDQFVDEEIDIDQTLTMPYDSGYYFKLMSCGTETGTFDFHIEGLPLYGMENAMAVDIDADFSGYLNDPGDAEWVSFFTEIGGSGAYRIRLESNAAVWGELYAGNGMWISANYETTNDGIMLDAILADGETYYLKVYPPSIETGYFSGHVYYEEEDPDDPDEPVSPDAGEQPADTRPENEANSIADPVDVSTGTQKITLTPFRLFGGEGLTFTIRYDSSNLYKGSLGIGWWHQYEKHLQINGQTAKVYDRPGSFLSFFSLETDTAAYTDQYDCTDPGKTHYHLSDTGNGYHLDRGTEGSEYYEEPDENGYARLVKAVTPRGAEIELCYSEDEDFRYISVIDPKVNQKILITTDLNGKILYADDALNPIGCTFSYDDDFLTGIGGGPGCPLYFTYNDEGRILTGTDGNGTCYFANTYDSHGLIIRQDDGEGHHSEFSYSPDYDTAYNEAMLNGVENFVYRPTTVTVTDREEGVSSRSYTNGLLTQLVNEEGQVKLYTYDGDMNLTAETDVFENGTHTVYDHLHRPVQITDERGLVTRKEYNLFHHPTRIVYDDGGEEVIQETFEYDNAFGPKKHTSVDGLVTQYTYNNKGQLLTKKEGDRPAITYAYTNGLLTSETDARSNVTRYEYNEINQMVKKIDALNRVTRYEYDDLGNLLKVTDPAGKETRYTYDCNGKMRTQTDALGNTTEYAYDGNMNLWYKTFPNQSEVLYQYDGLDRPVRVTDQMGYVTLMEYDGVGNLTKKTLPDGGIYTYEYDNHNFLTKETDPLGNVTQKTYNAEGDVLSVTTAAGTTSYTYDKFGRVLTVTDPLNGVTSYTYSKTGRLLSETDALNRTVTYTYDPYGNLLTKTDAMNNVTRYEYDANNNCIKTVDALNNVTLFEYDGCNQLVKKTDPKGNEETYGYDLCGRRTTVTTPAGTVTYAYDDVGNLLTVTDAKGNVINQKTYNNMGLPATSVSAEGSFTYTYNDAGKVIREYESGDDAEKLFTYDALGRLTAVTDELGGISTMSYDALGRVTRIQGPGGAKTDYTYDEMGRVLTESTPSGGTVHYTYDALGRVTKKTNARGQEMNYTYNAVGQVTHYTSPDETLDYTYNANGFLLSVSNGVKSIVRTYDALGRVLTYKDYHNKTVGYEYDANGNLTKLIYPDNTAVTYTYDNCNRMQTVTDWEGRTTSYIYDENGRVIQNRSYGDLMVTTNTYDNWQRLIRSESFSHEYIRMQYGYQYTYGAKSRLATEKNLVNDREMCYTYDKLGRVLNRNIVVENEVVEGESFNYDAAGNILNNENVYDVNNRWVSYPNEWDEPAAVQYDADGNMILKEGLFESTSYAYDVRNRLTERGQASYDYDAEGTLIAYCKEDMPYYVEDTYDPHSRLSRLLYRVDDDRTYKFVYGLGLISHYEYNAIFPDQEGAYREYVFDYRGSTVAVINETASAEEEYEYSTYGTCFSYGTVTKTPFTYNGRDGVLDGKYMRNRFYMGNGRFYNADILTGSITRSPSLNRYAYAEGNPVTNIDPLGLAAERGGAAVPEFLSRDDGFVGDFRKFLLKQTWLQSAPNWLKKILLDSFLGDYARAFSVDLINYNLFNESEQAVLDARFLSAYKGKLVIKSNLMGNNAFSFGLIVMGNGKDISAVDVKHEYGHTVQWGRLGIVDFTKIIAIPSLMSNIKNVDNLTYYSLP